jgi:hypothetical protein
MNPSLRRQVLECGDGVREVTALTLAALKISNPAADAVTPTQSGDSEDSVAAVQDARRVDPLHTWFMVPMCDHKIAEVSMSRKVERLSLWWGEATDEPAREDARPTDGFMAHGPDARPMLEVEALHDGESPAGR